jgi:hypothetical protein
MVPAMLGGNTMTTATAHKICANHSIQTRERIGQPGLEILSVMYDEAGNDISKWEVCPESRSDLMIWLGY